MKLRIVILFQNKNRKLGINFRTYTQRKIYKIFA